VSLDFPFSTCRDQYILWPVCFPFPINAKVVQDPAYPSPRLGNSVRTLARLGNIASVNNITSTSTTIYNKLFITFTTLTEMQQKVKRETAHEPCQAPGARAQGDFTPRSISRSSTATIPSSGCYPTATGRANDSRKMDNAAIVPGGAMVAPNNFQGAPPPGQQQQQEQPGFTGRRYSHVDSAKSYSAHPRLNTLTVCSNSIMVARARILLPQAADAFAQTHTRGPGSEPLAL
jgi:hypothetical protein